MNKLDSLVLAFSEHRLRFQNEAELQQGIAQLLKSLNYSFIREHSFSRADRADFLVGGIVIEAKIAGSAVRLLQQIQRYAAFPEVEGVIVVVSKARLFDLPAEVADKPVRSVLQQGW